MTEFSNLSEPSEFWEYFIQITKIPRCSRKEDLIREYIKKEAEKFGYANEIDQAGNILITIPPSNGEMEEITTIVIQSHMDMVCEKNADVEHDFSKDPLKLEVIELSNEKWLTAQGTTLGADNGVGIAYQLSLMKRIHSGELDFGPKSIKLLFTVDEEMGLKGASEMDKEFARGEYLINADSEEEDKFTIGCAGGHQFRVQLNFKKIDLSEKADDLAAINLVVKGLMGGHSGVDINKGRANAVKLLSQIMWDLNNKYEIFVNSINGGNLSNAIPREARGIFLVKREHLSDAVQTVDMHSAEIRRNFEGIENNLSITTEEIVEFTDYKAIETTFQKSILDLFNLMPNGPAFNHPRIEGLVHTSNNFAAIKTKEEQIKFKISIRSLTEYDKEILYNKILTLMKLAGLEYNTYKHTIYPSWPPKFDSRISNVAEKVYEDLFNEKVEIQAIHAGLECAYFSSYFPKMEVISIGPDVLGGHSPDERLRIKSVEKIWKFLVSLTKRLD